MGKLKFTLSNIFFWLAIVASCLILENVSFLSNNTKGLADTHFYMLFIFAGICYLTYFILDHIFNRSKVDYLLLGVLLVALGSGIAGIWLIKPFTLTGVSTYSFSIDNWERIRQTLSMVTFVTTLYSILFFFNKSYPSIRKLWILFIIVIVLCYIAIIYSLSTEMDIYIHNLTLASRTAITSFFWNDNMFCGMLLMGILASIGLNYFKKNPLSYVSIIGFLIINILVGSLTSVAISLSTIVIYFLIEIIFTLKRNVKLGILLISIYLFVLMGMFLLFSSALQFDLGQFSNICKYIFNGFQNANYANLSLRTITWGHTTYYLGHNPLQLIFGTGYVNSPSIVNGFWQAFEEHELNISSTHSGYYQILMNFGVIGLALYALLVFYYLYCFIKLLQKDLRFAVLYLLIGATMFAYSVMESVILFNPNAQGLLVGMIFYLPMINKYKHLRHQSLGDDTLEVEKPSVIDSELLSKSLSRLFMGLIATSISFLVFPYIRENESLKYIVLNVTMSLVLCLLFVPFIISGLSKSQNRFKFYALSFVNLFSALGLTIYLTVRYYLNPTVMAPDGKWIIMALMVIILAFEAILGFIYTKRTFIDYVKCFIGASKLSFMGLIGTAIPMVLTIFYVNQMELSPMTYIVYGASVLTLFYAFSFIIPFKDSYEIFNHYNSLGLYSLKMGVVKDRLEAINE